MIVGLSSKSGDLEINVLKGKKLTNMRTQVSDESVVLTPVRKMAVSEQLSMLNIDEALEKLPQNLVDLENLNLILMREKDNL